MKTNLMKSILHLKDDTEYQIPLREAEKGNRAKVGTIEAEEAANKEKATATQSQDDPTAKKKPNEISQEKVNDEEEAVATQSQDDSTVNNETEEISQEDVDDADRGATEGLEEDPEESQNQEQQTTEENNNNDTTTESIPQVDSAKAALDEMKKLASQEGVVHPSLFISNFSKILGLMERAMQLQVKESGSVTEEKAPETTEQTETPAKDKQGELNVNNRS